MCYNNAHLLPAPFRFRAGRSGVIFLPEKPCLLREWEVKKNFKSGEYEGEMCYNNAHLLPAPFRFRAGRSGVIF